jgi:hypothetical protein
MAIYGGEERRKEVRREKREEKREEKEARICAAHTL